MCLRLQVAESILMLQSFEYLQMGFSLLLHVIPLKPMQIFAELELRFILPPFFALYCVSHICCDVSAIMTSRPGFTDNAHRTDVSHHEFFFCKIQVCLEKDLLSLWNQAYCLKLSCLQKVAFSEEAVS